VQPCTTSIPSDGRAERESRAAISGKLSDDRAGDALAALGQLFIDQVDIVPLLGRVWEVQRSSIARSAILTVSMAASLASPTCSVRLATR
jgi:hypothetical protein